MAQCLPWVSPQHLMNQMWWCTAVILVLTRWVQKDQKFSTTAPGPQWSDTCQHAQALASGPS